MPQNARPVVVTGNGAPVTPVAKYGEPVTIVGGNIVVARAGDSFETDDGGTVTIVTIVDGLITEATYTPA